MKTAFADALFLHGAAMRARRSSRDGDRNVSGCLKIWRRKSSVRHLVAKLRLVGLSGRCAAIVGKPKVLDTELGKKSHASEVGRSCRIPEVAAGEIHEFFVVAHCSPIG